MGRTLAASFTPDRYGQFQQRERERAAQCFESHTPDQLEPSGDIVYGTPLGNTQLNATASFNSSSVLGAFIYTPSAGTVLNAGGNQSLAVSFTPTDTVNFNSAKCERAAQRPEGDAPDQLE